MRGTNTPLLDPGPTILLYCKFYIDNFKNFLYNTIEDKEKETIQLNKQAIFAGRLLQKTFKIFKKG